MLHTGSNAGTVGDAEINSGLLANERAHDVDVQTAGRRNDTQKRERAR